LRRFRARLTLILAVLSLPSRAASAQIGPVRDSTLRRCLDAIPVESLHEVHVYVVEKNQDYLPADAASVADSIARPLTAALRGLLGAAPNRVPAAQPQLTWRDLGGAIRITIRRDGSASLTDGAADSTVATDAPDESSTVRRQSKSIRLLADAFDSLRKAGPLQILWPPSLVADSIGVQLGYYVGEMDSLGYLQASEYRIMFPAFTLSMPPQIFARAKSKISLRYPSTALRNSVEGKTKLIFVVDMNGRAIPETIHDFWPPGRPRLTGPLGKSYDAFVSAAKEAILAADFIPASIGGCAVRQLVAQPFEFRIR
jgi:hypothetical protein